MQNRGSEDSGGHVNGLRRRDRTGSDWRIYYGHTREGAPPEEWEPLERHLELTAKLAEGFAGEFQAGAWGRIAGLWHDLGKYSEEFQARIMALEGGEAHLETRSGKPDHASAGAQHSVRSFQGIAGRLLAYCIAGHHGGLPDAVDESGGASGLDDRLRKKLADWQAAPDAVLAQAKPAAPRYAWLDEKNAGSFQLSVFSRFLYSCLVDADYLATESFMAPERAAAREEAAPPELATLEAVLAKHLAALTRGAANTAVNIRRAEVLAACRRKAELAPGIFSLSVPTGGGKTLSSLAFALKHAVRHGMRRVIYAIPFTSIIEQNADVFRKALKDAGPHAVLEHHSNFELEKETRWGRFASENWDAPVIVTTNVQLYESLFANKPSRCRKLHNIAESVIVLDEVQTLPVRLLRPTLAMLAELCRNYGCTVVLCSATQPAVALREDFPIGLEDVREIIDETPALFEALKRVEVELLGAIEDEDLTSRIREHEQVLCIVNTRKHAAELFDSLRGEQDSDERDDGVFHLSAQMCPAHRTEILAQVKGRLDSGETCRVVSTQLIEAGVDIDFPVVYRAAAGLDAIAQAAGRCNREGRRRIGRVFVFEADIPKLMYEVRLGAQDMREVAGLHADILGLDAIEAYFAKHYWQRQGEWDYHEIMPCFTTASHGPHFQFRKAAELYRLIDQKQQTVIVPYGDVGRRLMEELRVCYTKPDRTLARRLQRYGVGVYERQLAAMRDSGVVALYHDQYWVLEDEAAYDAQFGLRTDREGRDPEGLYF